LLDGREYLIALVFMIKTAFQEKQKERANWKAKWIIKKVNLNPTQA